MKRIALSLTTIVSALLIATPSFAAWSVTKSRHNFSTSNIAGSMVGQGNDKVCIFCHTPHAARDRTDVGAPLWNRQINTDGAGGYSMYKSPTLDANSVASGKPNGVSLACLSCHDGTVALDALVNAPGAGNYNFNPATGVASRAGFTFARGADDTYGSTNTNTGTLSGALMSSVPGSGSTYIPMLGTDLRNDHPISMNFAGPVNGASNNHATTSGAAQDPKFWTASEVRYAGGVGVAVVSENSTDASVFTKSTVTDGDIRLFADFDSTNAYKVQCASCHNPHGTDDGSGGSTAYPTFLQRSNFASNLCVACHIK